MKKRLNFFKSVHIVLLIVMLVMTVSMLFANSAWFIAYVVMFAFSLVYTGVCLLVTKNETKRYLNHMGKTLDAFVRETSMAVPIAAVVIDGDGGIVWYNKFFRERILKGRDSYGERLTSKTGPLELDRAMTHKGYSVSIGDKIYTAFAVKSGPQDTELVIVYFVDDTELKLVQREYWDTRPSVMLITLDNYDDFLQTIRESERAQIVARVEDVLEAYLTGMGVYMTKIARDRFLAIVEERSLRAIMDDRFSILDRVREITSSENMAATLSIGVGHSFGTLRESEAAAKQALDMALGRGGDQAGVKTQQDLDFYGGVSKAVEKRTKVKTRVVATALAELIMGSDDVIVMGHRSADLDAVGASVGMYRAVTLMGKPCVIALNKETNMARSLVDRLEENGYEGVFVSPEDLIDGVTKKTLLIIVDTHTPHVLESAALYEAVKMVVVIDHHRKMVNHIDNAVIFYHEPFASSAAEMVTELIQYFDLKSSIGKLEAEALLAGIMLDTKNFVIKTGVRTFEAAAALRKLGADTVEVRKLFAESMETYQKKTKLVAGAEIYKRCAIVGSAMSDNAQEDLRVAVPQAADELLTINGVDASFVYYEANGEVSFSARSMGAFNVQIIMEQLGGGGHHTMAGTQITGISLDEARRRLLAAIDDYYVKLK